VSFPQRYPNRGASTVLVGQPPSYRIAGAVNIVGGNVRDVDDLLAMDELVERHARRGRGRTGSRFVTAPGGSAKHDAVKGLQ
jgi:hypothetical protein